MGSKPKARAAGSSAPAHGRANSRRHSSKVRNRIAAVWKSASFLLEALFYFDVDAERAVLIAQSHNRDIAIDVVLHLDHLLLRGAHVRNVGDGQVARDLLFDGD